MIELGYAFKAFIQRFGWHLMVATFLLLHIAIKFTVLSTLEIQGDEAFTIYFSQQDLSALMQTLNHEANPPLYFVILHYWISLWGTGAIAVKSLSVLFSVGTALGIVALGKRLKSWGLAILGSLCFLFSNLHFEFSHEVRAFQLVLLLTIWSFYFYFTYIKSQRKVWLIGLLIINCALPFSHYNAVLVPFAQFASILFWMPFKKWQLPLALSFVLSALLFVPQLHVFLQVVPDEHFWLANANIDDFNYVFYKVVGSDRASLLFRSIFILSPGIVWVGYRFDKFKKEFEWRTFAVLWTWFALPLIANFILGMYIPSFRLRYVLFTSLGMYAAIGYLLGAFKARGNIIGSTTLALMALLFSWNFSSEQKKKECWKDTANTIEALRKEGSYVVVCAPYKRRDLAYYLDREAFNDYKNLDSLLISQGVFAISNPNEIPTSVSWTEHTKIALILSHNRTVDPRGIVQSYFDDRFQLCQALGGGTCAEIRIYNTSNEPCFNLQKIQELPSIDKEDYSWQRTQYQDQVSQSIVEERTLKWKSQVSSDLHTGNPFSPSLNTPVAEVSRIDWEGAFSFDNEDAPGMLVISIENEGESLFRKEFYMNTFSAHEKNTFQLSTNLKHYPEGSVVKCYLWNPEEDHLHLNVMRISVWKR